MTGTPLAVERVVAEAFDAEGPLRTTYAVVVTRDGEIVLERYGGEIEHWDRANEPVTDTTPLLSWSVAKSILHAAVGILVGDGRLTVGMDAPVAEWQGDERAAITLDDLLAMRDGLQWNEDYVDAGVSDVIEMLFASGQDDVAAFAASRPLAAPPGTRFNYSSGTSNVVSRIVAGVVGPGEAYETFLRERLFAPVGMSSASPRFDAAGTFIGSSYVYASARDFARFGQLYLQDGAVDGTRLLPEGWVDHGCRERSVDVEGQRYGAHWWVDGDGRGTFSARGYEGQSVTVCPAHDLVVVRLGKTPAERAVALREWRGRVVAAFD